MPSSLSRRSSSSRRRSLSFSSTPRSRSSSRGSSGTRTPKLDLYSKTAFTASSDRLNGVPGSSHGLASSPSQVYKVKRWDGTKRTTTNWDSLRRDPELWFPSGDCLVHFYGQGQSKRGPSLRLSLAEVEASNCRPLLEQSCAFPVPESPSSTASTSSEDGGYFTNPSSNEKYELYIPAPAHLNKKEAFTYHLTTRNFFAWMFEKPLVGSRLGEALTALHQRMNEYRPDEEENEDDFLAYIDSQDYTDFRECPDHALAVLYAAETLEYRDLWTDAFVHCVGMNNRLVLSAEFLSVSRMSKALITRAHLEMDLRLEHVGRSLGNFLEDDLSNSHLGLPVEAQLHLERFRSFLYSFYVQRHGYWPPTRTNRRTGQLPKSVLRSMYFDFRNLYDYLVNPHTCASVQNDRPVDGGICVLQNIAAFDKRHKYTSLPHPLPRVPEDLHSTTRQKSTGFSRLFGSKHNKKERRMATLGALSAATNSDDVKIMECALVREYFRFEREWSIQEEEKISSADGRKVRWIIIYAVLQTLISVTRAPTEVRDTEGVSYPLCCQTAGTPPWKIGFKNPPPAASKPHHVQAIPLSASNTVEIKPDTDYFALRTAPPVAPPQAFLSARCATPSNASTTSVSTLSSRKNYREIVVNGYGNGATTEVHSDNPITPSTASDDHYSDWSTRTGSTDDSASSVDHFSMSGSTNTYCDDTDGDDTPTEERTLKPRLRLRKKASKTVPRSHSSLGHSNIIYSTPRNNDSTHSLAGSLKKALFSSRNVSSSSLPAFDANTMKPAPIRKQISYICVEKVYSIDSFKPPRQSNGKVDRYFSS